MKSENVSLPHPSIPYDVLDSTVSNTIMRRSSTFPNSNEFTTGGGNRGTSSQSMIWIGVGLGLGVLVVIILVIVIIALRRREGSGSESAELTDEPGLIEPTTPWAEMLDTLEGLNPIVSADPNTILTQNLDTSDGDMTRSHG
jgi:hypothetical protein